MTDAEAMRTTDLIEELPRCDTWMCYILLGYGCIYVGQTGAGENRFYTTLQERPWAISILWIDVRKLGIHKKQGREKLEAQVIFNIFRLCEELGDKFHVTNIKFTRSLGRFSKETKPSNAGKVITIFMNHIMSHRDPRGYYLTDNAASHDDTIDEEAQRLSQKRMRGIMSGYSRINPQRPSYFEIILPTSAN